MADSENTAVNDLIARVSGGPVEPTARSLGVVPSGPGAGAPVGAAAAGEPMHTAIPAAMPVVAPFEARAATPAAPPFDGASTTRFDGVATTPFDGRAALPASYPVAVRNEPVVAHPEAWQRPGRRLFGNGEHLVGTLQLSRKRSDVRVVVGRMVLPIALLVLAGVLIGAYIALGGSRHASAPAVAAGPAAAAIVEAPSPAAVAASAAATAPVAAPAPAAVTAPVPAAAAVPVAAPAAAAVPAAAAAAVPVAAAAPVAVAASPSFVDVRIDSTPPGATVSLIDRGRSQLVGNTPISAAIDPSREYDLVLTYPGQPTRTAHLDPRTTRRLAVAFEPVAAAPSPLPSAAAEAPPPAPRREPARREPPPAHKPVAEPAPHRAALAEPFGEGTLMISSKPPCEIVIDGKPTGLTTPQRAIVLSAGRHKVTLINAEKDIKKALSVQIAPGETEKVIEDLMK